MFVRLLQTYVAQVKSTTGIEFGITDDLGVILACTNDEKTGQVNPQVGSFLGSDVQSAVLDGTALQKVFIRNKPEFVLYMPAGNSDSAKYLSLMAITIESMKTNYDEKYDKSVFIKSIMADKLQPTEISSRAKDLHIVNSVPRVVFIIKTSEVKDVYVNEIIQGLFPNRAKDFIIIADRERTVLVKELKPNTDQKEVEKTARGIADTLISELMVKAYVGIGTIVDNLLDIGRSYKEAETSLLIGSLFMDDAYIYSYNNLGMGRLIFQLPESNCRLFLGEYFKDDSFDFTDSETMLTIQKFFENNLNISETSRQLFVHRNTLVYRLDKIQKITGLDLRSFDDAIIFKMSMLVKRYLEKKDKL